MATTIAGFVASHVGTALTYVCCLRSNVDDLTDAAKDLEGVQADLQVRVDESNRNGEQILKQVEAWIEKAASAQVNAQDIFVNQNPGIFNLKSRYIMSKRAKETAESMNDLRDRCKFDHVSSRGLPTSMGQPSPLLGPTPGIESRNKIKKDIIMGMRGEEIPLLRPTPKLEFRKKIEEDIITTLRDGKVCIIGVCGMGGVRKTTMAKKIMNRAQEDGGLFGEVVMVTVGQQADMLKIQQGIADWLGFKLDGDTLAPRAIRLRARLQGGKRKLIIIDDVWERINLKGLGIPCESTRSCTILLTSRDRVVLHRMSAQRVFTIQILFDKEASSMFQENVESGLGEDPLTRDRPTRRIESRNKIEEDIITAMRDEKVYVIGLWGMGGVGKTTMANQIMHRAKKDERFFDEVLLVPVGQQADLLKIQHAIAELLGLRMEVDTLAARAERLQARLQGGKRKLIVIDDVWEHINLKDLGIPCQSRLCTILLTTRDMSVLSQMNSQSVFTIQILSEEEAWSMFQENVGAGLGDDPLAREVAKECKGLPLALVVVSRALKGKEVSSGILSDAVNQLKSSNPMDIEYVIKEVYKPIKLSYDFLESRGAKSLLFLCSSFPEDHEINLEYLALYAFGLGIFAGINTLEDARNRIAGLVRMLKRRFLILDGKNEHYVKMHDVVRDVAIFISSEENNAILEHTSLDWSNRIPHRIYYMLSVILKQSQFAFPNGLTFPKLSFFLWMNESGSVHPRMSDNFSNGMKQLKVLSITSFSFGFKPQNMLLLKNLRTLHLCDCILETLSAVGELSNLEILCCHSCPCIKDLPVEIGRLHRLRLLQVTNCHSLETIVPGVISELGQLEELKMLGGFKGWESQETEIGISNASLFELQTLSKLTCLEIEIEDPSVDAQALELSSKIVKYNIQVGERSLRAPSSTTHEKKLHISLRMDASLANWIDAFSRTVEYLCLEGVDYNGLDSSDQQNRKLVSSASTDWEFGVFPVLEVLYLSSLPMLEEICDSPIPDGSNSFAKLKKFILIELHRLRHAWKSQYIYDLVRNLCTLHISRCRSLLRVFWLQMEIWSVSHLETLEINYCESMKEVFWIDFEEKYRGSSPSCIIFSKLEKLSLGNLRSLNDFCKGMDIIEFPKLVRLEILSCPKLTSFSNASDENHVNSPVDDSVHIFCNTKVTFGSLKRLHIGGYEYISYLWCRHIPRLFFRELEELTVYNIDNINNLFSYSIAANLINLRKLTIEGCNEMVYAIAEDDAETSEKKPLIMILHALKELTLNFLPKLQNFCEGRWNLQLPSLERLDIEHCPAMEKITKSQSTPNSEYYSANVRVHLFCNTQITFDGLKDLCIGGYESGCDHIDHLFSYSMAGNFLNLETLSIYRCSEMVYVIADDEDNAQTSETKSQIIFHKLQWVELRYLPKMRSLCDWAWDVRFPALEVLNRLECPGMDGVTPESMRNQNLEAVQSRRLARERS